MSFDPGALIKSVKHQWLTTIRFNEISLWWTEPNVCFCIFWAILSSCFITKIIPFSFPIPVHAGSSTLRGYKSLAYAKCRYFMGDIYILYIKICIKSYLSAQNWDPHYIRQTKTCLLLGGIELPAANDMPSGLICITFHLVVKNQTRKKMRISKSIGVKGHEWISPGRLSILSS